MEAKNAKLVRIDKNGSKHFEGYIPCDRCGGETGLASPEGLLTSGYICPKCTDAIARTGDFLNYFE